MATIGIEIGEDMLSIFRSVLEECDETRDVNYRSNIEDLFINESVKAEIIRIIKNDYNIHIPERDIAGFKSVVDFIDYVESRTEHH